MRLKITRETGFFGMGSPLQVLLNNEVITNINEKQIKEIEVTESRFDLQIKFFLLKSPVYSYSSDLNSLRLKIILNPKIVQMYIALFLVSFLIPVMLRSIAVSILIVTLYIVFILRQLKRAYLLIEV